MRSFGFIRVRTEADTVIIEDRPEWVPARIACAALLGVAFAAGAFYFGDRIKTDDGTLASVYLWFSVAVGIGAVISLIAVSIQVFTARHPLVLSSLTQRVTRGGRVCMRGNFRAVVHKRGGGDYEQMFEVYLQGSKRSMFLYRTRMSFEADEMASLINGALGLP